jgi:hypothetical protein
LQPIPQSKKVDADSLNVGEEKLAGVERPSSELTWCAFDDGRESGPLRCIGGNRAAVSTLIGPIPNPKKSVCSIGGSTSIPSSTSLKFGSAG